MLIRSQCTWLALVIDFILTWLARKTRVIVEAVLCHVFEMTHTQGDVDEVVVDFLDIPMVLIPSGANRAGAGGSRTETINACSLPRRWLVLAFSTL